MTRTHLSNLLPHSRLPSHTRRRRRCIWVGLLLASAPLQPAFGMPETGLEGRAIQLSDTELSDMRGKFVSPANISYFGITLASSWQGADGVTTFATIMFDLNFASPSASGEPEPRLLIGWSRDGDAAMDVTEFGPAAQDGYVALTSVNGPISAGGLSTIQGAVQSHDVTGSDNNVLNNMSILVVPVDQVKVPTGDGLTTATTTTTQNFADGDSVQFMIDQGHLALVLTSGSGPDAVRQGIDGQLGQAAQHVLLESSLNTVNNVLGITIGLDQLSDSDRIRVTNALASMKGGGF